MIRVLRTPDSDAVHGGRVWFLGVGAAWVVLGLGALLLPFATSVLTTLVLGWLLVLAGLLEPLHSALDPKLWTATTYCMPVSRRMALLRLPEPVARADREACLRHAAEARSGAGGGKE